MKRRTSFVMLFASVLCAGASPSKSRKDVPLAPLPAKVVAAKKVFLANGGGSDLAYDALYAAVKEWPRFEIVDASVSADIIIEIRYVTEDHGTRVWSTTNASTGATNVHSRQIVDPQLVLTIFDPDRKRVYGPRWNTVVSLDVRRTARKRLSTLHRSLSII
jgi:hypothetical protein